MPPHEYLDRLGALRKLRTALVSSHDHAGMCWVDFTLNQNELEQLLLFVEEQFSQPPRKPK